MEALQYLQTYARSNPTAAAIISGAIACFAAVAVIGKFGIDLQATIPSVIYVIGIGLGLFVLVRLLDGPASRGAATYFIALLFIAWIAAFFWSRAHPRNEELACAVYFWKPCVVTADDLSAQSAPSPRPITLAPESAPADARASYRVFIQFAGYDRPTIVGLADALVKQGWKIQGANQGGERIGAAASLAEVRYGNAQAKATAEALASALNTSKVSTRTIKAVQNDAIGATTLEIWIGQ